MQGKLTSRSAVGFANENDPGSPNGSGIQGSDCRPVLLLNSTSSLTVRGVEERGADCVARGVRAVADDPQLVSSRWTQNVRVAAAVGDDQGRLDEIAVLRFARVAGGAR